MCRSGLFALLILQRVVHDPDYLKSQQPSCARRRQPFDTLGLVSAEP